MQKSSDADKLRLATPLLPNARSLSRKICVIARRMAQQVCQYPDVAIVRDEAAFAVALEHHA